MISGIGLRALAAPTARVAVGWPAEPGCAPLYEAGVVKWAQSFSMRVFRTFAADMRLGQLSIQAVAGSEVVLLV